MVSIGSVVIEHFRDWALDILLTTVQLTVHVTKMCLKAQYYQSEIDCF